MHLLEIHEPGQTPLPHQDALAIGIDLGTTHSVVAIADHETAEVLSDAQGHRLVPSMVYYGEDGVIEVGHAASQRLWRGELGVIASIKRLMGRGVEDAPIVAGQALYEVESGVGGGMARVMAGRKWHTPVEISADILRHLKALAEQDLGREVTQAVITVPAYFDDAARSATKDAARLAGLQVLRLINEPTAAALAYGLQTGAEGIYAVYDLGGGTFDLSLLKLEKGVFQVLATGGDTLLGGDDIDHALAAWALGEARLHDADQRMVRQAVMQARAAKEALSVQDNAVMRFGGHAINVTRTLLEELTVPFIERTLACCAQVLHDSGYKKAAVRGVILVGGSTRMPLVRARVQGWFGREPYAGLNPDEVVAIGAALQAKALTQDSETLLLDVVPLSLGLETMGGLVEKLIPRNTPIPVSVSQEFTTYQDGQTGMEIHVTQGERELVQQNRSLARFELTGIPFMAAGMARIKVTFTVDADGLLTVSAREQATGAEQTITVMPSYGLNLEEMEAMLRESMQHAREDITQRLLVESRVEAQRLLLDLRSAIDKDGALLKDAERQAIERQAERLHEALKSEDRDRINAQRHSLEQAAGNFAQRRMDRSIQSALQGRPVQTLEEM